LTDTPDEGIVVRFDVRVHSLDSVKRAAYAFTDRFSFDIRADDDEIACIVTPLSGQESDPNAFIRRFRNAVLDQDLRESVANQTENVRNVILAHAFSKTGLQND
jgi:His-Xaa-Ser system protein HxsD